MASSAARRIGVFLLVLAGLWALWEGFKWFGERTELQIGTFMVNDITFPHLHDIVGQLFEPSRRNGPLLIEVLWDAALFTAKEAVAGFLLGAAIGLMIGIVLHHSRLLQRGVLPYIVASQTVPILAIAPMVVVWLGTSWVSKAVIAAYLTFFPVTVNMLRGLRAVEPDALALMRALAATPRQVFLKLRFPASLPYLFTALRISATASVVGAIIGELPVGSRFGMGVVIINAAQYYNWQPANLWAAILVSALLGIAFYHAVAAVERRCLRWRPVQS
jgi:NitT/TauT family transport system permease protein